MIEIYHINYMLPNDRTEGQQENNDDAKGAFNSKA